MAIDIIFWGLAFLWGGILGFFYFGGLWVTLRLLKRTNRPKFWLGVSYIGRVLVALIGFWLIVRKSPGAFLLSFIAFLLARTILTRILGKKVEKASMQLGPDGPV